MTRSTPARPRAPRGRLAPSPTGYVHLGNARTALVAWLSVRSRGGALVWRLEDIDTPRVVPGMAEAAEEDLAWLGLDWDEGPHRGGAYAPYVQSERQAFYLRALERLEDVGRTFPCTYSRRDLEEIGSAPHGAAASAYPVSLRPNTVDRAWLADLRTGTRADAAIRFQVDRTPVRFDDRLCGKVEENVEDAVGDFVLRRRDGLIAYQLAVVVDDLAMEIDDVVRGADLLDSTARQIQLLEALGGSRPDYAHVALVRNAEGQKLSKRDSVSTLRSLRAAGVAPAQIVGYLAWSLGLADRPTACAPRELISRFSWDAIARDDLVLPGDPACVMAAI